jgi:hypothetical protein
MEPVKSANEAYASNRSDIARLMDVLQMELDKHAEQAHAEGQHWGHVADLSQIRTRLINAVTEITGEPSSSVEQFLAEAIA